MRGATRLPLRLELLADRAARRAQRSIRARLRRVVGKGWLIGQSALAAGVALFVSGTLLGHATPFVAPIVAVICLGLTYGQRLRRVAEVTVGAAVGVLISELFTGWVGSGPWQVTLIVGTSMAVALFLDAGSFLVTQAAINGIVIGTLSATGTAAVNRWIDALVGGGVALVAAMVVPSAPVRRPLRQAAKIAATVADLLRCAARAAQDGDVDRAVDALGAARATDALVRELQAAAQEGQSVVESSPFHRGAGDDVERIIEVIDPLDYAVRSTRVLVRRALIGIVDGEAVPPSYIAVLDQLAEAADVLARSLHEGAAPGAGRSVLLTVAQRTATLERTPYLSVEVVLAQMRSVCVDLLQVTGLTVDEAVAALPPVETR